MSHDNQWIEKVARGRALVSEINDRKWELGDLANEVVPAAANGVHNDGLLGEFASEIGITVDTLRKYRMVATSWPAGKRFPAQTWTTHMTLAAHPDRFDIIAERTWTYNSLSDRLGRLPNPSRVNRETGEILDDLTPSQVADAIKADPAIASTAAAALRDSGYNEPAPEVSDFQLKARHADEVAEAESKSRTALRFIQVDGDLAKAAHHIKAAAKEARDVDFTDEERELLEVSIRTIRRLLDFMENGPDGWSETDWDAELAKMAGGL